MIKPHITKRPRRLRMNPLVRDMIAEFDISRHDLIYPVFVTQGQGIKQPVASLPGQFRYSLDLLIEELKHITQDLGMKNFVVFPHLDESQKDRDGSFACSSDNYYYHCIEKIKELIPDSLLMSDLALDPYSLDGHDGLVDSNSEEVLNDETLEVLGKMAVLQAQAGIDIIGPSDMMDGRVGWIRSCLDQAGFKNTLIMSYTANYASSFYGPFRDALESAPKNGDKKSYQMDFRDSSQAVIEASLDESEGADILMVKPALAYLDIIAKLSSNSQLPVAAYQVSGEYAMICAASQRGWLERDQIALECLTAIKRAGAKIILSYFAKDLAKYLR